MSAVGPILLSSARVAAPRPEDDAACLSASLAENAFARLNYEAMLGDGRKARFDTDLRKAMTPESYQALCDRLALAGVDEAPRTYADVFNAVVYMSADRPMLDHGLLLASGILSPTTTAARLRDALRFDDDVQLRASHGVRPTQGAHIASTPAARPLGWASLGEAAPSTADGQPTRSGWYLRIRLAWPDRTFPPPLGSHSAIGYYDADARRWGMTSSLDYEYEPELIPTPGIGGEMGVDSQRHQFDYYPIAMGPTAERQGMSAEQFDRQVQTEIVRLEAHYRRLAKVGSDDRRIFYHFFPSMSSGRIDGNCNTFASYVLKTLGVEEAYPTGRGRLGTIGNEVVARNDAGDVFIYGSGTAAKAARLTGRVTNPYDPRTGIDFTRTSWRAFYTR